jgi:hypothetical protein
VTFRVTVLFVSVTVNVTGGLVTAAYSVSAATLATAEYDPAAVNVPVTEYAPTALVVVVNVAVVPPGNVTIIVTVSPAAA